MDDLKHLPVTSSNDDHSTIDAASCNSPDKLLTTDEVAVWLGIKKCTLEKARSTRIGNFPSFIRIGRGIRYRRSEVEAWLHHNSFNVDGSRTFAAAA